MREADFQAAVIALARLLGWEVFHLADARREVRRRGERRLVGDRMAAGWPDLVLAHPRWGVLAARELKADRGRLTAAQRRWLQVLAACGVDVGVWRPRDWREVELFLRGPKSALRARRTRRDGS